ncbi:alpha/beta hydrolase [bacterium]|nr:alpha/beta hydrolase [bacterium]
MKLVFVHGWSVTHTNTYGRLPEALIEQAPEGMDLDIKHIFLGKYISFHDEVTVDDIARAFEHARLEELGDAVEFSCITHSTGGPVMRAWVDRYYGADRLSVLPLKHLVMLAPANHGSALAQLGKGRLSRIKTWFQGVEPGQGVLNWLELGSDGQRKLNLAWLTYESAKHGFFPFVLTGETIDYKLYDHLNTYTGEKGSDGVVRIAGANLNYHYLKLRQDTDSEAMRVWSNGEYIDAFPLVRNGEIDQPLQPCPLEVIPNASHSGKKIGIMRSVRRKDTTTKPVVHSILECLAVKNEAGYQRQFEVMADRTRQTQANQSEDHHKYAMVVFRVSDDQGNLIHDYDLYLLAGQNYDIDKLAKGFFMDRQKNRINNCSLTYYLDCTVLHAMEEGKLGFRVVARPDQGFIHYSAGEFHSGDLPLSELLRENETLMVDIELKRHVDTNTFRIVSLEEKRKSFKPTKPSGDDVE